MSHEQIQVLHVDDDPEFADLTGTYLERADDRFTVETATSADEGLESVTDRPPDCVVSDYNMPGRDGIEFLEAVREDHPDLPFILFTGKGSEAVASDAISAGATDYLQKQSGTNQYDLLANRIRNAVAQYRSEKRLDETRKEYSTVFENAQNALLLVDVEDDGFRYQQCNPQAVELIGRDRSEIVGAPPREALGPENGATVVEAYRRCVQQHEPVPYTVTLDLPVGRVIRDCEVTPVSSDGDIEKLVVEFRDITEQRERRRDLDKVDTLFQHAQDSLFLVDVGDEFTVERVNPAYEDTTGLSASAIQGRTPEQLLGEEQATAVEARYRECVERREPLQYTEQLQFGSDPSYWETRIAPVVIDGTVEYIAGSTRDVTDQRERRQELEEFETIIEALSDAVYVLDEAGRFTYVNDGFVELVGYDRETILGSEPSLIKGAESVEEAEHQLGRLLSSDGPDTTTFEVTVHPRDGDPTVCEDHMGVVPYEGDEFDGSVGTLRDVTDRRERERELARTHDLMTNMEALADVGAWEYDSEAETLVITDGIRRLYGLEPDADLTLEEALDAIHPDDRDQLAGRLDTCLETGEPYEIALRLITPDGTRRWVTARGERVNSSASGDVLRGYIQDITEQKQIERDLRQERDLLTGIVETVPVGISVVDADGSISFINERMESIGGRSLEELEDMSYDDSRYDLVGEHGNPLEAGDAPFDVLLSEEAPIHDRVVGFRRPSGERVWADVHGSPQYDENGELERAVFAFEDITDQRELEAELSEIFDRISDAFYALDGEFRFTHVNSRAEELLEASEDELLGETVWEMFPEAAETDEIRDAFDAAMDTQATQNMELYYEPLALWLDVTVYPSESGISVYFRNVTARKEREQELQELKSQYQTLAENFPDGAVYLVDTDHTFVRAHGEELRRVGFSPDDFEGKQPHDLFPEEIADTLRHYTEDALDGTGNTFEQEYRGNHYRIRTTPVRTGGGEITHAMAVSQNVTDEVADRQELADKNERLEELASIVSHDLRNPLGVAEARLELAQDHCDSDHLRKASDAIGRSQALIDDLLTLARESDEVDEAEPVDLAAVAKRSWGNVETAQATLDVGESGVIEADRSRLQQLFENLYRNSVEHGSASSRPEVDDALEHGGDDLTVSVEAMSNGFAVADTGPGIPESEREAVFEAGYSTSEEGTGLGLRIVEQIADAHGWALTVTESEQGGARFEFTGVERVDR